MTDFVTRDDDNLGVGRILTSPTMYALYDNLFAMASGAAGAPRIQTPALNNGVVTAEKLAPPTAGTAHIIRRVQETPGVTGVDEYESAGEHDRLSRSRHLGVTVLVPGVITAYAQHRRSAGTTTPRMRVLKNGALVQEWGITSSSFVARQVNISVDVGDVVIFQQRGNGSGCEWRLLRIYSNNPNMAVA